MKYQTVYVTLFSLISIAYLFLLEYQKKLKIENLFSIVFFRQVGVMSFQLDRAVI